MLPTLLLAHIQNGILNQAKEIKTAGFRDSQSAHEVSAPLAEGKKTQTGRIKPKAPGQEAPGTYVAAFKLFVGPRFLEVCELYQPSILQAKGRSTAQFVPYARDMYLSPGVLVLSHPLLLRGLCRALTSDTFA